MKIALVSPIEETVPPELYGGIEWIIYFLARELPKYNHEVHLLTTNNSPRLGNYKIIPIFKQSIRRISPFKDDLKTREVAKFIAVFNAFEYISQESFDVVHNHANWRFLLFQKLFKDKFLTTLHGPLNYEYQNLVFKEYKDSFYVSISNNQRKDLPELNFIKTIYNAIDIDQFDFKEKNSDNYLLFFARFSPEKGPDDAIIVAKKTKKKLIIGAKIDKNDQHYFNQLIDEINHPLIEFHGEIDIRKRVSYYQNAKVLLAPIKWEEPFGLMFTEAMATGTPVITYARGSVPEIIKDGITGYIVNSSPIDNRGNWIIKKTGIDGLCEAVERIYSMPEKEYQEMRYNCRKHVEKYFTVDRMVDEYIKVYQEVIKKNSS